MLPSYLVPKHIFCSKCFRETNKIKLDNFILKLSENFKQNAQNLGYKHLNPTKNSLSYDSMKSSLFFFKFFKQNPKNVVYKRQNRIKIHSLCQKGQKVTFCQFLEKKNLPLTTKKIFLNQQFQNPLNFSLYHFQLRH